MGCTHVLERSFGEHKAAEMIFTGKLYKGRQLKLSGMPISDFILPRAQVEDQALMLADDLCDKERLALMLLKQTIANRRLNKFNEVIQQENSMHEILFNEEQTRKGIKRKLWSGQHYYLNIQLKFLALRVRSIELTSRTSLLQFKLNRYDKLCRLYRFCRLYRRYRFYRLYRLYRTDRSRACRSHTKINLK